MDASEWDERYAASESVWGFEPNQFVRSQMVAAELPPGRAVDLGCGEGRNALWLAGNGWDVLGVDFSEAAIDKARATAKSNDLAARFEVGDVLTYPLASGEFDLVLIAYMQFAREARLQLLDRAMQALTRGGTLLVVAHDLTNLEQGYGGPQTSSVLWSADETAEYLEGYSVDVAEVVERHVDTDDGPRVALDTLVRARKGSESQVR